MTIIAVEKFLHDRALLEDAAIILFETKLGNRPLFMNIARMIKVVCSRNVFVTRKNAEPLEQTTYKEEFAFYVHRE